MNHHQLTECIGKLKVSELFFEVPRDYSNMGSGTIQIFARSVARHEKSVTSLADEDAARKDKKPWFVYLTGGPGYSCQPPQDSPITNFVLDKGYQMLYIDQRGTGLSTPISAATLGLQGDIQNQADYLKLFRADNIVRDWYRRLHKPLILRLVTKLTASLVKLSAKP